MKSVFNTMRKLAITLTSLAMLGEVKTLKGAKEILNSDRSLKTKLAVVDCVWSIFPEYNHAANYPHILKTFVTLHSTATGSKATKESVIEALTLSPAFREAYFKTPFKLTGSENL